MAYSKVFKPEKYEYISNVVSAVQALKVGTSMTVKCQSEEALERTRYLLYDYLFHLNLKIKFRIKTLDSLTLLVQRLGFIAQPEVRVIGDAFDQSKVTELIDFWGEPEARVRLEKWVESGELSRQEGAELWEHVTRIMS